MVVEVFGKERMTGWSMVLSVSASSICVGCLCAGLWSLRYGTGEGSDDEIHSLYIGVSPLFIPPAIIFGYYGCAESWIFVGVTSSIGTLMYRLRLLIEHAD